MRPKRKWASVPVRNQWEAKPAKIINDAAVAAARIGDGKLIPLVIVDTTDRPDLEEYVRVHQHLPPGDVKSQWGHLENSSDRFIALFLDFLRPAELLLVFEFDVVKQGAVVDQIITSRALYIQPGREGDRLSTTLNVPRVLVEIPDVGFDDYWAEIRYKNLVAEFRRRGLRRSDAKEAARMFMEEWSKFGRIRFGASRDPHGAKPQQR